ncbi:hypothetical protein Trydic_g12764 [Trypoxylus dichotomus]
MGIRTPVVKYLTCCGPICSDFDIAFKMPCLPAIKPAELGEAGCPKETIAGEMITRIRGLVANDRRLKVRKIADTIDISKERVGHMNSWI